MSSVFKHNANETVNSPQLHLLRKMWCDTIKSNVTATKWISMLDAKGVGVRDPSIDI